MKIVFKKTFVRQYGKLDIQSQKKIEKTIELFEKDPFDPQLRNHALKGILKGKRSISAGFDLRIIFEEQDGYALIIMLAVGSHNQLY